MRELKLGLVPSPINKCVRLNHLSEFNPEKTCEVIGNIHQNPELLEEK